MRSVRKTEISGTAITNRDDPETILLVDSWRDEEAIDVHHASPMMAKLAALREKYDLHMKAERFLSDERKTDERFLRK